jgi:arsenate reductase (glutaredoxin)
LASLPLKMDIEICNIKDQNIDENTLDWLKEKVGSYEALFSKKAMKYRSLGLNLLDLTELDYKKYMLEEYTFLRRPFIIHNDNVWIGNTKQVVESAANYFAHLS